MNKGIFLYETIGDVFIWNESIKNRKHNSTKKIIRLRKFFKFMKKWMNCLKKEGGKKDAVLP